MYIQQSNNVFSLKKFFERNRYKLLLLFYPYFIKGLKFVFQFKILFPSIVPKYNNTYCSNSLNNVANVMNIDAISRQSIGIPVDSFQKKASIAEKLTINVFF